jgi:hypothetical protein
LRILVIAVNRAAKITFSRNIRSKFLRRVRALIHHCLANTATIFAFNLN